ncbi:6675_t:CDS:1, partial [Racocetra persica]
RSLIKYDNDKNNDYKNSIDFDNNIVSEEEEKDQSNQEEEDQ